MMYVHGGKAVGISLMLLVIFVTFSIPIEFFTNISFYPVFFLMFFFLALFIFFEGLCKNFDSMYRYKVVPVLFLVFYLFTHLIAWVSGVLQNGILNSTLGLIGYIFYSLPVLMIIASGVRVKYIDRIIILNCYFSLFVGAVAIYQILFDPLLFGIYVGTNYEAFDNWSVQRANSIMGSIQIYSAYMLFSALSVLNFRPFKESVNFIFVVFYFLAGALGGSQVSIFLGFLLIFVYAFVSFSPRFKFFFFVVLIAVFSGLFIFPSDALEFGGFKRLSGLASGGVDLLMKLNESRLSIWSEAVRNSNFMSGNGLGSASILVSGAERYNTESFIFSAYYSGGFQLAFFYVILFLFLPYYLAKRKGPVIGFVNSVVFFSYALVVHVYFGVLLIIPWVILLGFSALDSSSDKTYDFSHKDI